MPNKNEVLDTVRLLATLSSPVWLAGGVAADFHVGRWTRDHEDIDLLTYEEHRKVLSEEFGELGFRQTQTHGWITHWKRDQADIKVSVAYERRVDQTTGTSLFGPTMPATSSYKASTRVFRGILIPPAIGPLKESSSGSCPRKTSGYSQRVIGPFGRPPLRAQPSNTIWRCWKHS
jgi:hypothetical protein